MKKGYIKDDLMIIHHYFDPQRPNEEKGKKTYGTNKYIFLFVKKGTATARNGAKMFDLKENQIMIVDIHNAFGYEFVSDDYDCLWALVHPTFLYENDADDKNFLRAFENIQVSESVIDCEKEGLEFIPSCIDSIIDCISSHLGKTHILPRIKAIISELCMYYDKKYDFEANATDSLSVSVFKYVNRNYLKNITYQTLMDEFFITKPLVNEFMRLHTGTTLRKYIEQLRLKDAHEAIHKGLELNEVARMCGFPTYSTFYRAYTRNFGESPKETLDNRKQ